MSEAPEAGPVVVFDLDGTVVAGDSFAAFLRHLITGHRLRHGLALASAPAWLPALLLPLLRLVAERWLAWLRRVPRIISGATGRWQPTARSSGSRPRVWRSEWPGSGTVRGG